MRILVWKILQRLELDGRNDECRSSNDERNPKSECRTQSVEVRHSRESGNPAGLPPGLLSAGVTPCAGATAKSDAGLLRREVHPAKQFAPARI